MHQKSRGQRNIVRTGSGSSGTADTQWRYLERLRGAWCIHTLLVCTADRPLKTSMLIGNTELLLPPPLLLPSPPELWIYSRQQGEGARPFKWQTHMMKR